MTLRFESRCLPDHVGVTVVESGLLRRAKPVSANTWSELPDPIAPAIRRLLPLLADGSAKWQGDTLLIDNGVAAQFPSSFALRIGLPDPAPIFLDVTFHKAIADPDSRVQVEWKETSYQRISPERAGIEITWGNRRGRLTGPLFALVEAVDDFNRVGPDRLEERLARWTDLTAALERVSPETVTADSYTRGLTVFQAGSFALDVKDSVDKIDFDPILMSRSRARSLDDNAPAEEFESEAADGSTSAWSEEAEPSDGLANADADALLANEDHRAFLRNFYSGEGGTRKAYPLRRSTYLVVDDQLRHALNVVKNMKGASDAEKRAFAKNPRTAIARELGLDDGDEITTALFIETRQYSDRVIGLGLWEKPELSWLSKARTEWLPERFPVEVQGQTVEVGREDIGGLVKDVLAAGDGVAPIDFAGKTIDLSTAKDVLGQVGIKEPSTNDTSTEARPTPSETSTAAEASTSVRAGSEPIVVKVKTNFEGIEYAAERHPRTAWIERAAPAKRLITAFKQHQVEGFKWLVDGWATGWPGVLLADDMGLGKSFQALAFLAWLKENQGAMRDKGIRHAKPGPILIVAPTALLENWIKESEKHLVKDALGKNRADLFGSGSRRFRNPDAASANSEPLDWRKLAEYDWILTTYETLADTHTSVAKIHCSVVVFDEMQKIKDPGTLNTNAATSVNADFVLGLTGTPIENRIEDLWSIMERIFPSLLGGGRQFSATYRDGDPDKYRALSDMLMKPIDGAPAILLRRMKDDVLEGLPKKTVVSYRTMMPSVQAEAYGDVVAGALSQGGERQRGAMLEVVQKLRGLSLYPGDPTGFDLSTVKGCEAWIERSARIGKTFEILSDLDKRGEKALIFIESRQMQTLLSDAISTMFRLEKPLTINGATPGQKRQGMVDAFERRKRGFDLMLLSPKAAGVGLTIIAANHVIHLSRWWNPAVEDQCNDRVYRIGQDKPVSIHIPISVHPTLGERTFDVTLNNLLDNKRRMSRNLLAPPVSDSDLADVFAGAVAA